MPTLVEKLQLDAMDQKVSISDLLRRVKFTAAKLGLGSVEDWVEQELNGYQSTPREYRLVTGTPKAFNPIRGWMDMGGNVGKVNRVPNFQPVSARENLLNTNETGALRVRYRIIPA